MSLKDALANCLITFDSRVLVSDLLEQYKLTYAEVQETLSAHIAKIEKSGTKFEKRFIVHGEEKETSTGQQPHDIFTIVQGEGKLSDWLSKLKNAESVLYSVQIAGGAKAPAQAFKPLQQCAIQPKQMELRNSAAGSTKAAASVATNGNTEASTSAPAKAVGTKEEEPAALKPKVESKPDIKKTSPKSVTGTKKSSPTDTKAKPTAKKGSINNFFSAAPAIKKEEPKEAKTIKPTTPKKMEDFFKKQAEKPAATVAKALKVEASATNTSIQLFDDECDNEDNASSSDEEEKLELLRRDIISADTEPMDEDAQPATSASKRRRILDSDDEDEQPQQKKQEPEKEEASTETIDVDEEDAKNQSESFLDEEGFVITIKAKKSNAVKKKTSPPQKSATTTTAAKKSTPPNAAPPKSNTSSAKTKQGNIMSFFTKK